MVKIEHEGVVLDRGSDWKSLARTDVLDKAVARRVCSEVSAALRRRNSLEERLGGALRLLAGFSVTVRRQVLLVATTLLRRKTIDRPLFRASVAALGDTPRAEGEAPVVSALQSAAPPLCAFAAAARLPSGRVAKVLAELTGRSPSHVAFAAEFVRTVRGEAIGDRLVKLAPMINEASRVLLTCDLVSALVEQSHSAPPGLAPALAPLRTAERHTGRWLRLGELGVLAGDEAPIVEARQARDRATGAARTTWQVIAWILSALRGWDEPLSVQTLSSDVLRKLSDQPSAQRDHAFLFRLGRMGVAAAEAPLAKLAHASAYRAVDQVHAAYCLAKHYACDTFVPRVESAAARGVEAVRGASVAALWDLGKREEALLHVDSLMISRSPANVAWGALVRMANLIGDRSPLVTPRHIRWLHEGRYH
jgi:hypothetical protein